MKNIRFIAFLLTGTLLLTSCATPYVWNKTDPDSLRKMPKTSQTEDYIRRESLMYAPDPAGEHYYVEKRSDERRLDYACRIIGMPFALAFDFAMVALLVMAGCSGGDISGIGSIPDLYTPDYKPPLLYSPYELTNVPPPSFYVGSAP
jgi:hypothetical protein